MDLVTRGRLSVQRVGEDAWAAIELMAKNGGWEELDMKPKKKGVKSKGSTSNVDKSEKGEHIANSSSKRKRGTTDVDIDDTGERHGLRRSNRAKK
jgi:hypothetical protein